MSAQADTRQNAARRDFNRKNLSGVGSQTRYHHGMADKQPTVTVKIFVDGEETGMLLVMPKTFSTGSTGYFGTGKVSLGDEAEKGYQVQVQMVRIGSKPAEKK